MLYLLVLGTLLFTFDAQAQWSDHHGTSFDSRRSDSMPERSYGSRNSDGVINNALIVPRHGEILATPPPAVLPQPVPHGSDPPYQMLQDHNTERERLRK